MTIRPPAPALLYDINLFLRLNRRGISLRSMRVPHISAGPFVNWFNLLLVVTLVAFATEARISFHFFVSTLAFFLDFLSSIICQSGTQLLEVDEE